MHLFSDQVLPSVLYSVEQTPTFREWHRKLCDLHARASISRRIDRAKNGNLGDAKPVGEGVYEMRVDVGPGYRLHFTQRHGTIIVLLCGGDKRMQNADIRRAQEMAKELKQ